MRKLSPISSSQSACVLCGSVTEMNVTVVYGERHTAAPGSLVVSEANASK
jgi:hypothetical protein